MSGLDLGLNAVILAVTEEEPRIITVRWSGGRLPALPYGPLDTAEHRTLERAVRGWVREQAGMELGYVEQLYTFGDRCRARTEVRSVSVAYLALVREAPLSGRWDAQWEACYRFFPWEDWRCEGPPAVVSERIVPELRAWVGRAATEGERERRQERVEIAFGLGDAGWNVNRVLERYELLYEANLVPEAELDRRKLLGDDLDELDGAEAGVFVEGRAMALDHRRMVATALARLRGKLTYRPLVFELMPEVFTLLQLQRVVEALSGVKLHKQNFRRLVDRNGLVEGTGMLDNQTGGRPAELFRFRREVLRERPAPGVGLPGGGANRS